MSDILKITTPFVNRGQAVETKRGVENIPQFDVSRIHGARTEPLSRADGLIGEERTSALLLDLLKDPSVTATFLKNVYLLQEVFNLLPANNKAFSEEMEDMFSLMLLSPDEFGQELLSQQADATRFRGELFNFLHGLIAGHEGNTDMQKSVLDLLKALNLLVTRQDILDAVSNSLLYLGDKLASSKSLSDRLLTLAARFRASGAVGQFATLREDVFALFDDIRDSILFDPQMDKVLSITTYNLSRFQGDTAFVDESTDRLLFMLGTRAQKEQLSTLVQNFVAQAAQGGSHTASKVLDMIAGIITRQANNTDIMLQSQDELNRIIQSLLSSPTNFTPLLHFVLPAQYMDTQAFMEIWVNPNGEEDDPRTAGQFDTNVHLLMVFEVGELGRFEMELFVRDRRIDMALFTPAAYTEAFKSIGPGVGQALSALNYQLGDARFEKLVRPRSLMEVFRSLPHKRTGVDVKA